MECEKNENIQKGAGIGPFKKKKKKKKEIEDRKLTHHIPSKSSWLAEVTF